MSLVRIATRQSPLALWQAEYVKAELQRHHPGLQVELVKFTTQGDKILDAPLAKIGGKGLFVKELENALLAGEADIAVHSMKDVPVEFPEGLHLATICPREDCRDAFVSNTYARLADLPAGAKVGTSSLRRRAQLVRARPDLVIDDLRGNVGTRLGKLDAGQYDAIILAVAGLKRLDLGHRITEALSENDSLPAAGQGAVGIECRQDDARINALLTPLHHAETALCVRAERAMNARLMGGCQVPIAALARVQADGRLLLRGRIGEPDGSLLLCADACGADPEALGQEVADALLAQGAGRIIEALMAGA